MSIVNTLALESNRQIKINFDGGDLSSDAGLLLIKEFISKLGIDTLLEKAFKTNDPVFKSVLEKDALASQPTVSRFFNRMDEDTLKPVPCDCQSTSEENLQCSDATGCHSGFGFHSS